MSILIKGMEMPEAKETFLRIDDKGNVKVYGNPTESYEAVSVPPHGRLIDADALPDRFDEVRDLAPTIIEAEEGET